MSVSAHRAAAWHVRAAAAWSFAACLTPSAALATCGASVCLVNTDWSVQGAWHEPGLRADLRYEFVDQSRPMTGSGAAQFSPLGRERKTVTQRLLGTVDWGLSDRWGLSLAVPFIDRQHGHTSIAEGGDVDWRFRQAGDVRLLTRFQPALGETHDGRTGEMRLSALGLIAGVKLPTGPVDIRNANGALAERSLQPGTGTTDLVIGLYYRRIDPQTGGSWFAQAMHERALDAHAGFRPGARTSIDAGFRIEWRDGLAALGQINLQHRRRDQGVEADGADSGGLSVALSPGLSMSLGERTQLYGFYQHPVHQHVNGTQLGQRKALIVGLQHRF